MLFQSWPLTTMHAGLSLLQSWWPFPDSHWSCLIHDHFQIDCVRWVWLYLLSSLTATVPGNNDVICPSVTMEYHLTRLLFLFFFLKCFFSSFLKCIHHWNFFWEVNSRFRYLVTPVSLQVDAEVLKILNIISQTEEFPNKWHSNSVKFCPIRDTESWAWIRNHASKIGHTRISAAVGLAEL